MEKFTAFLEVIDGYVWGIPLIVLIMGTGILLSAPLRIRTNTTTTRIIAKIISPASVPFAIVFPLIKFS